MILNGVAREGLTEQRPKLGERKTCSLEKNK